MPSPKKLELTVERIKYIEESKWLRISNLKDGISENELAKYIRKESKLNPESVEIEQTSSPFAFVQMETSNDAQNVVRKLQMSSLKGQKMWIQQCRPLRFFRNEHFRGIHKRLFLCRLPQDVEAAEITKMCGEHGDVKKVKVAAEELGYSQRRALVVMSTAEEAAAVFDALHQEEVRGCTITTAFKTKCPNTNSVFIGWFPESVGKVDVYKFVKQAVNERPLSVDMFSSRKDSEKAAFVVFSNNDLVVRCIAKLNGKKLGGNKVRINEQKSKKKADSKDLKGLTKSLKVKLSMKTKEDKLNSKKRRMKKKKSKGKNQRESRA